jgi:hypothetical protein
MRTNGSRGSTVNQRGGHEPRPSRPHTCRGTNPKVSPPAWCRFSCQAAARPPLLTPPGIALSTPAFPFTLGSAGCLPTALEISPLDIPQDCLGLRSSPAATNHRPRPCFKPDLHNVVNS